MQHAEVYNMYINTYERNDAITEALVKYVIDGHHHTYPPRDLEAFEDSVPHDVKINYTMLCAVDIVSSMFSTEIHALVSKFERKTCPSYRAIDKIVEHTFLDSQCQNWYFFVCLFAVMREFVRLEDGIADEMGYDYACSFNSRVLPELINCFFGALNNWVYDNKGWIAMLDELLLEDIELRCKDILCTMGVAFFDPTM